MMILKTTSDVIILVNPATGQIVRAAYDFENMRPALLTANPGTVAITGQAAKLLFQAITGRLISQSPDLSNLKTAKAAKIALVDQSHLAGWSLAIAALAKLSGKLLPNLGTTLLSEDGKVIPDTHYILPAELANPVAP